MKEKVIPIDKQSLYPALVMSLSSLIAFSLYYFFQWSEGYWSVISIAAITQLYISNTLLKMILRIAGTLLGAFTAYYAVHWLPESFLLLIFFLALFLAILFTLAASQYRYLMIITGLTFTLVIAAGITHNIQEMAIIRTYEVILGCVICAVVSLVLAYFFPNNKGPNKKLELHFQFHPGMLLESFVISFSCFLTFLTWRWFQYPFGFWAAITCLFVIEENLGKTLEKGKARIIAHVVVSFFASIIALIIPPGNPLIVIPIAIGLALIGYCLSLKNWIADIANTMGIAWSIMLLVNDPTLTPLEVVAARFLNVVYGVSVAFLVIYLSSIIAKRRLGRDPTF